MANGNETSNLTLKQILELGDRGQLSGNFVGPQGIDNTVRDAQGNFEGRIRQPLDVPQDPAASNNFAPIPAGLQETLARGVGAGAALPGLEVNRDPNRQASSPLGARLGTKLQKPESREKVLKALTKAEADADKGGEGFKVTDIFNVLGAFAKDKDIAANSIGRLVGKATGQEFQSPGQRQQAAEVQKQQATQAMQLLLEKGRQVRADNRLDLTKKKFAENRKLREQEIKIQEQRIKNANTTQERLSRESQLKMLRAEAKNSGLQDSLLAGGGGFLGGKGNAKQIAEEYGITTEAAQQALSTVKNSPNQQEAAKLIADRLAPVPGEGGAQAPAQDEIITLSTGRKFNTRTGQIVE